ncbi:MAG: F0F1 ATP synthase subunit gamma [Chthoniobacterales bacterium]
MSDTLEIMRRKIAGAEELQSVVRTMKALAAASIGEYEGAVRSLAEYYRTVELGLAVCLRATSVWPTISLPPQREGAITGAIVFGSDQGLVGQFNEALSEFTVTALRNIRHEIVLWAVGERMDARLTDQGMPAAALFAVPNSVNAITPLVGQILAETEVQRSKGQLAEIYLFHNQPLAGAAYEPVSQRLLPLDEKWRSGLGEICWPSLNLPEVIGKTDATMGALIREYLFVSVFKACAESLASENASRLAGMQRAERNIGELLENLIRSFHQLRQTSIDEELFDLVSGFEALSHEARS